MTRFLLEQYGSAKDLLAEWVEYHGERRAYITNPARNLAAARCPVCCAYKPRLPASWELQKYSWRYEEGVERHWIEQYPILLFPTPDFVEEPTWDYLVWCDCSEVAIMAEILKMRRDRQLRHAQDIEATILAMEEEARTLVH